jgi:hypothetical protein
MAKRRKILSSCVVLPGAVGAAFLLGRADQFIDDRDCTPRGDQFEGWDGVCTQATCLRGVRVTQAVDVDPQRMPESTLEICHAENCMSATRHEASTKDTFVYYMGFVMAKGWRGGDGDLARVRFEADRKEGLTLHLHWHIADHHVACIGDPFRIVLRDRDGKMLLDWDQEVVSYHTSFINGPGCPPLCRVLELRPRKPPLAQDWSQQ